jgi:hypothetical protein
MSTELDAREVKRPKRVIVVLKGGRILLKMLDLLSVSDRDVEGMLGGVYLELVLELFLFLEPSYLCVSPCRRVFG